MGLPTALERLSEAEADRDQWRECAEHLAEAIRSLPLGPDLSMTKGETPLGRALARFDALRDIGITDSWVRRRSQHAREKSWWDEVAHELVIPLAGREEALWAEQVAIRAERPRYNIIHVDPDDQEPRCGDCDQVVEPPNTCLPCAYDAGFKAGRRWASQRVS